ncbi:MAG: hypothetical protein KBT46_05505 [Ruminococcus sp.]|nr:hypothetical protein [Candidatus Copronaster equi]
MQEEKRKLFNGKWYIPVILAGVAVIIFACALMIANITGVVRTYRISSDNGFAQNDIALLQDLDDVYEVYGTFIFADRDADITVRPFDVIKGHEVLEGTLPVNIYDIAIDDEYAASKSCKIGDVIKIAYTDFNVVGIFDTDNVGYEALAYKNALATKQYSNLIVGIKGNKPVVEVIQPIKQKLINNRIQEIYKDANKEILELEDEYNALDAAAKEEIEKVKEILDGADNELKEKYAELESYYKQLEEARKELDESKKQLDSGKIELEKAEAELKAAKAELDAAKSEYLAGRQQACDELGISDSELDEYLDSVKQYTNGDSNLTGLESVVSAYNNLMGYGRSSRDLALEQAERLDNIDSLTQQKAEHILTHEEGVETCEVCDELQAQIDQESATSESTYQQFQSLSYFITVLFSDYTLQNTSSSMRELAGLLSDASYDFEDITDEDVTSIRQMIQARDEIPAAEEEYAAGERDFNKAKVDYESAVAKYEAAEAEYKKQEQALQEAMEEWNKNNDEYNQEREKFDEQVEDVDKELEQLSSDKLTLESEKDNVSIEWSISGILSIKDKSLAVPKALAIAFVIAGSAISIFIFYRKKYGLL